MCHICCAQSHPPPKLPLSRVENQVNSTPPHNFLNSRVMHLFTVAQWSLILQPMQPDNILLRGYHLVPNCYAYGSWASFLSIKANLSLFPLLPVIFS